MHLQKNTYNIKHKIRKITIVISFFLSNFLVAQSIGVALQNNVFDKTLDGSYDITFEIKCQNYSNDSILNLNVSLNLFKYFREPANVKIKSLSARFGFSSKIVLSNIYGNSASDSLLLSNISYIVPNESINLTLKFNLKLNGSIDSVIFINCNMVGIVNNKIVSDISTDGEDPDPDGNRNSVESISTKLEFLYQDLIIPNVITPNGDKINDVFFIKNLTQYQNQLTVFNRWGNVVYHKENYQNNWEGNYMPNGYIDNTDKVEIPEGIYYYILQYGKNASKYNIQNQGFLQIFR